MVVIEKTDAFNTWVNALNDKRAKAKVLILLDRMKLGNNGDVKPVGEGVSESRINYGKGLRIYFVRRGKQLIVVLGGGDKSTQSKDIKKAKQLAKQLAK